MPRIRCRYVDCVYIDDGICGAAAVMIDPDEGCLTYTQLGDVADDDDWDDDDLGEIWDVEDEDFLVDDDEDDDMWLDDDEI